MLSWGFGGAAVVSLAGWGVAAAVLPGEILGAVVGPWAAWLSAAGGVLLIRPLGPKTGADWAPLLFGAQFLSLLAAALLAGGLLYSPPRPSATAVLPSVSVGFVSVWIAIALGYGASSRDRASG